MTTSLLGALAVGVVVFASTNIDDIFLLSAFFADQHLRTRNILIGQFAGIGCLVAASAVAALAALAVPEGWIALLGIVPLILGVRKLWQLRRVWSSGADEHEQLRTREHGIEARTHSQVFAVGAVTVANGGDNLSIYIPLFANDFGAIPVYALIFALMTAVWCVLGYVLVNNRVVGDQVRRYGHIVLPFVLIGLGLYILSDIRALLR